MDSRPTDPLQNASPSVFNTTGPSGNAVVNNVHGTNVMGDYINSDAAYSGRTTRTGCLDGTREPVISTILGWKDEVNASPMCWLSGPAGYGKSAVLQSVAESCARDGTLAASFFFLRGAGQRSEFNNFITTLAFQITMSIPEVKLFIQKALHDNPTIPYQSTTNQLHALILRPLMALHKDLLPSDRLLVVIDALDECNDRQSVQEFIAALADACSNGHMPLLWLFTSRGEEHIRQAFSKRKVAPVTKRIQLETFNARMDIEKFLRSRFNDIIENNPRLFCYIPRPWPSPTDLKGLVGKSSGLFIFASTLVYFITDGNAPPDRKLRSVLEMHAGLDPLYDQVLRDVPEIDCFRRVLTTLMLVYKQPSVFFLAEILELNIQDVLHALMAIQSIITIPSDDRTPIQLNHTSLRDFLVNADRSNDLFVDPPAAQATIAVQCINLLQKNLTQDVLPEHSGELYAAQYWLSHLQDSHNATGASSDLLSTLKDFSSSQLSGDGLAPVVANIKAKFEAVRIELLSRNYNSYDYADRMYVVLLILLELRPSMIYA
ncbi:hypothetical protein HWV62_7290 [Athelia sp. TMB]|nr:hypothetical protein HWV62_7290 [Athelia sp. TMB]